jgi:hypothetical protein
VEDPSPAPLTVDDVYPFVRIRLADQLRLGIERVLDLEVQAWSRPDIAAADRPECDGDREERLA